MLALILASLLGFSLFFELILRISTLCFHFPQGLRHYSAVARGMKRALYMPDPHSLYKLRPGRYRIGGLRITVNEAGFRYSIDPDRAKEENEIRVLLLGGSTCFDIDCSDEDSWSNILEDLLRRSLPDSCIHVINGGVPGYTTAEMIPAFALRGLQYEADVILFDQVHNDVNARIVNPSFRADYTHYRPDCWQFPGNAWLAGFCQIYGLLRLQFGRKGFTTSVYQMTVRDFDPARYYSHSDAGEQMTRILATDTRVFERNLRSLISIARSAGAVPVLATGPLREAASRPAMSLGVKQGNETVRLLSKSERVPLIDIAEAFPADPSLFNTPCDPMHLNPEGARIKGELVAAHLLPVLESIADGRRNRDNVNTK